MQRENQDLQAGRTGNWSWQDSRRYFRTALIGATSDEREQAFADTFRALGQVMHLVVDASVPEHVRNDEHPLGIILGNYEYWVAAQHDGLREDGTADPDEQANFIRRFLSDPSLFDPSVFQQPTNDPVAKVPVARLIDTDTYTGLGSGPNVTRGPNEKSPVAIGIAEIANANFFSEDTGNNQAYPFPDVNRLTSTVHQAPKTSHARAYFKKPADEGLPADPVLAECVLFEPAVGEGIIIDPVIRTCTDENVWTQMASIMLPRAVGYARGVLDYFFRGTLDFTIGTSSPNQTLTITNKSGEVMEGTFALYADNFSDVRSPVASFDLNLGAGASSAPLAFTPPAEVAAYVLVFQGKLGLEEGAVAGRVKTIPVNAFFVWHVRVFNDQLELLEVLSSSPASFACFIRVDDGFTFSGKHSGLRRDYLFFAFVNDPALPLSPLDPRTLQVTARIRPAPDKVQEFPWAIHSPMGGRPLAILQGDGGRTCGQFIPYHTQTLGQALLASQVNPSLLFPSGGLPPPNHYVFIARDQVVGDTGIIASEDIVVTQRLTLLSLAQISQLLQGLHPRLTLALPNPAAVYAVAQFDLPQADPWNVSSGKGAYWDTGERITPLAVAEMWELQDLTLQVPGETDITQRFRSRNFSIVFGPEFQRTHRSDNRTITSRRDPEDPFNFITESSP